MLTDKKQAEKLLPTLQKFTPNQLKFTVGYLTFFGYLTTEMLHSLDKDVLEKVINNFQKTFDIPTSGALDRKTYKVMKLPRCGCPDKMDKGNKQHVAYMRTAEIASEKRNRWNKEGLTFSVKNYIPGKLPKKKQLQIFTKAFQEWDVLCNLQIAYTKNTTEADIVIGTGKGKPDQFDGRGGTLAWAYMPKGDDNQLYMQFDLDEIWIDSIQERGILLSNVACHEFGHLLGLQHSKKKGALMAPYYNPFIGVPQANDDIPRIQKLYGTQQVVAQKLQQQQIRIELEAGQELFVTCK